MLECFVSGDHESPFFVCMRVPQRYDMLVVMCAKCTRVHALERGFSEPEDYLLLPASR